MSHDYHDALPGFHSDQIMHDGCRECEERATWPIEHQVNVLDAERFVRAIARAAAWQTSQPGFSPSTLSRAEMPLLRALHTIHARIAGAGV